MGPRAAYEKPRQPDAAALVARSVPLHTDRKELTSNLKMKDGNMRQKLHIAHHNEMHIAQKHPPMLFSVNEDSIEPLRNYHVGAAAIANAFISGIKLEFISH